MSGVGKSAATDYLTSKGYPKVNFVSVILDELKKANLEPTLENEKMMRDKLRREEGNDVVSVTVGADATPNDAALRACWQQITFAGMAAGGGKRMASSWPAKSFNQRSKTRT